MIIRRSTEEDVPRMMEIYARARAFMAAHGNPDQWGPTNWPPEALIRRDVANGNSYVCEEEDRVVGTFFFACGRDIEPTYAEIEEGQWLDGSPYGVVHRIAADGTVKGTGSFCLSWAFAQCGHLRVDTHGDNRVMQNLLEKLGFVRCGTIWVEEDDNPRLAYEKTSGASDGKDGAVTFDRLMPGDGAGIAEMSAMASAIVREHFDPIIGKAQNDYMLNMFQTPEAIQHQLDQGCRYYFVRKEGRNLGFLAFYPRESAMYLSKFYLYREERGKGYARPMMDFVVRHARQAGLPAVELNVNRNNSAVNVYRSLGLYVVREEKNEIGSGFFMDDFVFRLDL